jgi:hypothetical protein
LNHHTNIGDCQACEDKLKQARPELQTWYRNRVKGNYQNAHISWSFRNQADQTEAVAEGKSNAPWPTSPHNACDPDGNPCSTALDLFQVADDGKTAIFSVSWYKEVNSIAKSFSDPIKWGGEFHDLGDFDHFQWSS